jgi:Lrp/AsnC family leucine-responsive transcriptional regulator
MEELDETDLLLLDLLQSDGRMALSELAQRVGLTGPTVQRRVRLLEERGYIKGYAAIIDPLRVGLPVTAFIFIESRAGCDLEVIERFLSTLPSVQEIHRLIGEWCFLLKIRTHSPQALEQIVYHDLRKHPDVRRTHSTLATSSVLETARLQLPVPDADAAVR